MTDLPNLRANFMSVTSMASEVDLIVMLDVLADRLHDSCLIASRHLDLARGELRHHVEATREARKNSQNIRIAGCGDDVLEQLLPPHGDNVQPT